MKKIIALLGGALLVSACENDSPADLTYPVPQETITYNAHVKTIINNNCIICHGTTPSNGAPMPLTTYSAVKQAVQSRGLLDRISRPQGAPGMMPNGGTRLPQSQIELINQWAVQGLQE
ncbi:MAG: hypothetical protein EOO48_09485 [Flavobacterium sp.]|nr:MAG: hypothetical protein EOO48_09485 [Flavobacterium sp.]